MLLLPITVLGMFFCAPAARSVPKIKKNYPLWAFDEQGGTCRFKGRLQDHEYCISQLMDRIVADGKDAIPILISQLSRTRPTKEPIYDYWNVTTEGDIAYFILMDLFTESNGTFQMPGLESIRLNCKDVDSETCWRAILKERGRKFVQDQWLAAWDRNKELISWDESARCFRLSSRTNAN
jgi:hypothetical protein